MLKPGWSRDRIMEEVGAAGVPCYSGSCSEIYLEKAFDVFRVSGKPVSNPVSGDTIPNSANSGHVPGNLRLPVAKELGETSLMQTGGLLYSGASGRKRPGELLVHPTLTEENISDTIRVVKEVVARASR